MEQVSVNRQAAKNNTYAFYVLGADGSLLASSDPGFPQTLNQSQYPHFIVHQIQASNPDDLLSPMYIGLPQIGEFGTTRGNWVIPVSRRIPSAGGEFAGVAVTLLSLRHLQQFYDAMRPAGESAVGLLSAQGRVIARSPFAEQLMGADITQTSRFQSLAVTHRLLAFARKQPLNPRRTDVNLLVAEIKQLLRRTVTENIEIALIQSANWKAMVDPHELQNALLNLCLNARDAMPEGGKLTIETQDVEIDAEYAALHEFKPGFYLMIAVSDTGYGMTPEVVDQVFQPFYTTKKEGEGTGLGLSMVYGFALQSHGQVRIYSEPGEGTTVRLFLPRALGIDTSERLSVSGTGAPAGSKERILLVEDDDLVRLYALTSLRNLGYQVIECSNGHEALEHLNRGETFDLLFTDVVLTGGISGKQVAEEAQKFQPGLKILYMSGYTENAIVHHGSLDPGVNLLSKPFRLSTLADKIRSVLKG